MRAAGWNDYGDTLFSELMSEPFTVLADSVVSIGFTSAYYFGFNLEVPRIIAVSGDLPPVVTITDPPLSSGKTYATVQGPTATGVSVTATAVDAEGLQVNSLKILNNGTQVGASSSTSPLTVTLPALGIGTYTLSATAVDVIGMPATVTRSLKVNNPPQGGFTLTGGGVNHVAAGQSVSVTVTALPTDTDGSITLVEVLQDAAVIAGCTRTSAPWNCTVSLPTRASAYSLTARATDSDSGVTTYAASAVTVNTLPSVMLTAPTNGSNYSTPATIALTANASDVDGAISKVEFFKSTTTFDASTLIGTVTTAKSASAGPPAQPAQSGALYTFNWANSVSGTYPITARATDDRGGTTLSTQSVSVSVNPGSTTTVSTAQSPGSVGQPITLTANVSPNMATGTVDFKDGGTTLCAGVALTGTTNKSATCTYTPSVAGAPTLTANYTGMTGLGGSSGNVTVVVNKQTPTLTVTSSPASPAWGQSVTLTAYVSPTNATGTVAFTDNNVAMPTPCNSVALYAGTASCTTPAGNVGSHTYRATYSGDGNYASNMGASPAINVSPAPLTCTLNSGPTALAVGNTATLVANCKANGANLAGVAIGWSGSPTCSPISSTTDANGNAQCTTGAFGSPGAYGYTFTANGGANYLTNTPLPTATVNVYTNPPPRLVLSSAPTASARVGTALTYTLQASDDTALTATSLQLNPATNTMTGATIACSTPATSEVCTISWTPPAAGVFTLGLTLTDSLGATTNLASVVAVSETPGVRELTVPVPVPNSVAVGTTAGQFAVSESGAATYSIPIAVPPGIAGLQPNLALTYNSQGGDGPLGVGWNLSGLSSITRCPKTIATDGVREPINYDNITDPVTGNDAFCLDGQRLIPVSGGIPSVACVWPVGSSATPNNQCAAWEFRTEIESYSRIIGIGDNVVAGSSGSGPTRFRVYAKSGQILEYGSRWWGVGAPRPDPQTSLITNPSFEDTYLYDSCWLYGSIDPNLRGYGGAYVYPRFSIRKYQGV